MYKNSGVPWLGDVPAHWQALAIKRLAQLQSGESITAESIESAGEYPVFGGGGLRGFTNAFTHEGHYVLIGRQGALCGNVNYAQGRFWASEHAVVVTPVREVVTRWLGEVLRAMNLNQYSVSAAQPGLSVDVIERVKVCVPPVDEQRAIAAFLDRETAKIDALVAEQRRLMDLLREKRQAVISHAVTRGLDPNAPTKDSGVQWLGEVPAHWSVVKVKRLADIRYGIGEPPAYHELGTPLIRATNVHEGKILQKGMVFVDPEDIPSQRIVWLEVGDILVVRSGAYTGDSAIIPEGLSRSIAGFDMVVRCHGMLPQFMQFALLSSYLRDGQIAVERMRAAQPHLNAEELGGCHLALPPQNEQVEICSFLANQSEAFEELLECLDKATLTLAERRATLITAAVTGQIDVRGLAAAEAA